MLAGQQVVERWPSARYRGLHARLPALRAYFARRVPTDDIDDMLQEVALRLQACTRDDPLENGQAYLFQIARSVLNDRARRDGTRQRRHHETLTEAHHPIEELSPARVLEAKEQLLQVLAALDRLPERTRRIFVLHRFERTSHAGIATLCGVSVSAVEKHIMRAMKRLVAELAAD